VRPGEWADRALTSNERRGDSVGDFDVIAQSRALASPRLGGGLQPSASRRLHSLKTLIDENGPLWLKLVGSTIAGAAVSLAIMNNLEGSLDQFSFQSDYPETSVHSSRAGRGKALFLSQDADRSEYQSDQSIPLNFPRVVKTLRFLNAAPSQAPAASIAALTDGPRMPLGLKPNGTSLEDMHRPDGSMRLRIPLQGSLQNPAWSPDGQSIAFTRFRNGYNKGPADVYVFNLVTNTLQEVAADGSENVSQPGSTWNRNGQIVFSSDKGGHDEIWIARGDGTRPRKVTSRSSQMAYEPSFAPDGQSLVFESHKVGVEKMGRIVLFDISRNRYADLTAEDEDCRQPNWSPRGDYILYQKHTKGQWNIWLHNVKTRAHHSATASIAGDKTDATFSPDGRYILYSGEVPGTGGESLLALPVEGGRPVPITRHAGYHGAPSWSPDGAYVAMEASARAPDGTAGTELIVTPMQKSLARLAVDAR
jgi:TolB protein